ncbi:MAG: T9SS type A sorting domain-containing protein [Ignavibacteriae bacterium]|nr:T9SS type A sorting domain-containing protein [Ignavibacteriota bacterium]
MITRNGFISLAVCVATIVAAPISTAQIIGFFPPSDSFSVVGSCVAPSLICELHSALVDTVIIRPMYDPMYIGPPLPTSVRIERCYFTVRDINNSNQYTLVLKHHSPYHPDSIRIPFDTSFYVSPGSFDLTLFVRNGGTVTDSATARFYSHQTGLSVDELAKRGRPAQISLSQNFPNPFNPSTTIEFEVRTTSIVTLEILTPLGQRVATLLSGKLLPGVHRTEWRPNAVASGMYLCRLRSDNSSITRKIIHIN